MKPVSFVADNAARALARIYEELGPDAVVISVRKLPVNGISRLWHHRENVEVMAGVPDEKTTHKKHEAPLNEDAYVPFAEKVEVIALNQHPTRHWRSVAWLESLGLLPECADRLEQKVGATHGDEPPPMPIAEWTAVRDVLAGFWQPARQAMEETGRPHVFVGPAGSGKTTVLCKWMTMAVLAENHSVRVWQLDGESANTSELLSLQCEMIGVPVSRYWMAPEQPADLLFVDLPGVEAHNGHALSALREHIGALPQPHVHLVLNAAYETPILFEQFHAFKALAPEDIVFTHLDEERHRVKLWNFVLGTNCSLSFLSAGQKIPGDFQRAETALLFPRGIRH